MKMGTSNFLVQVQRRIKSHTYLLGRLRLALAFFIGLYSPLTLSADLADSADRFTANCVAGLERTGGRGANAAPAYCGCMAKAASEFNGDSAGMLAVMEAPIERKVAIFQSQNDTNKKIISACVTRIEEVYGVASNAPANTAANITSKNANQPQGIWADPDVMQAIQAINLSASQAKVFKASATKFSNDLRIAAEKILRESLDINRKLKKKRRVLVKRMDAQVMAVLKDDQKAQYQAFSVILVDKIKNLGRDNQVDQSKCMGMGMGNCG